MWPGNCVTSHLCVPGTGVSWDVGLSVLTLGQHLANGQLVPPWGLGLWLPDHTCGLDNY